MVERPPSPASRADLGLPSKWSIIMFWLFATSSAAIPQEKVKEENPPKNPEIPRLKEYGGNGSQEFWSKFPRNDIPPKPETKIDTSKLKKLVEENSSKLLKAELNRANRCIEYLEIGGPAFQKDPIGPCVVKNSKKSLEFGASVSDTIATWITKKFVAGPFDKPPLPQFRVNSILAVPQPNKTRICINVSKPEGRSFNDNIEKTELEKVKMSSARQFGHRIIEAGKNCIIAKPDIVDAYKNIPARLEDLRLQGTGCDKKRLNSVILNNV
jgi:hypothetical protein